MMKFPLQIKINQIVPPEMCFKCDVCCRFPEKDSFLAPYFTREEITSASPFFNGKQHIPPFNKGGMGGFEAVGWAPPTKKGGEWDGCKITLVPFREGYICPAFEPASVHCNIYDVRPLDCIIYPFAIMWSADGREIVLGLDMKCPYVAEFINSDSLKEAVAEMRNTMDSSPALDIISENPGLVGPYQDDVTHTAVLTNLTQALAGSVSCSQGHKSLS